MTLDGAVAMLNERPEVVVDLGGRRVFCSSSADAAALTVTTMGGTLHNGTVALPHGVGLTVESDCSLKLRGVLFEAVCGSDDDDVQGSQPAVMVALAARALLVVEGARLEGATGIACSLDTGAQVSGSDLTVRGAGSSGIVANGGTVDVARLRVESCVANGVLCQSGAKLLGQGGHFEGNGGAHIRLEDLCSADITEAHIACGNGNVGISASQQSRLTCTGALITGHGSSTGVMGAGFGTQLTLSGCTLRGHATACLLASAAVLTAVDCSVEACGRCDRGDDGAGKLLLYTCPLPCSLGINAIPCVQTTCCAGGDDCCCLVS